MVEPPTCADQASQASSLASHILPTSATMIGVCMTVLSIGHIGSGLRWHLLIDKMLAVNALVFLASALLSFASMRVSRAGRRSELWAEGVFVVGLGLMVLIAAALAFVIN